MSVKWLLQSKLTTAFCCIVICRTKCASAEAESPNNAAAPEGCTNPPDFDKIPETQEAREVFAQLEAKLKAAAAQ